MAPIHTKFYHEHPAGEGGRGATGFLPPGAGHPAIPAEGCEAIMGHQRGPFSVRYRGEGSGCTWVFYAMPLEQPFKDGYVLKTMRLFRVCVKTGETVEGPALGNYHTTLRIRDAILCGGYNEWERNFLDSLLMQFRNSRRRTKLSKKQWDILKRIERKQGLVGRWSFDRRRTPDLHIPHRELLDRA